VIDIAGAEHELQYLRGRFLTLDQLAERAGVAPQRVLELAAHQCIPRHSYEVKRILAVSSFISADVPIREEALTRFYAPAIVQWIKAAEGLAGRMPLGEVGLQVKARARAEYREGILELDNHANLMGCCTKHGELDEARFDVVFEEMWTHWAQGTYGLCVKSPLSVKDILRKDLAVARLARLTGDGKKESFSPDERAEVLRAMREYDAVAMPFAPHDYPRSSRKRLVDDVLPRLLADSQVAMQVAASQEPGD